MSLPELPPGVAWRYKAMPMPDEPWQVATRLANVPCPERAESLHTEESIRAFYAEGVRAGLEQAAVLCEGFATDADNIVTAGAWDNAINTCAEAIRASAKSGGRV